MGKLGCPMGVTKMSEFFPICSYYEYFVNIRYLFLVLVIYFLIIMKDANSL